MRERISEILRSVIIGFDNYTGNNLIEDNMLDSIELFDIIMKLEDEFSIEIPTEKMVFDYFYTVDSIERMVNDVLQKENISEY